MSNIVKHGDYLFVEVPEVAFDFTIDMDNYICFGIPNSPYPTSRYSSQDEYRLPPGQYTIVGKADGLTEAQWGKVCGHKLFEGEDEKYWYDYQPEGKVRANLFLDTPTASGLSLLASKKLKSETTLVIKKKKP